MRDSTTILILLAFCGSAQVFGQSARDDAFFRGTVVDAATGEPIPFVTITPHRPDNSWPGASDFDGAFSIRCLKNWLFVEVRQVGYRPMYFIADLRGGWIELELQLVPEE